MIGWAGLCDRTLERFDPETGEIFEERCGCGAPPRAERAPTGQAEGRPLGNTTEVVALPAAERRKPARKYQLLDAARRILNGTDHRAARCMLSVVEGTGHATILRASDGGLRVGNVAVCGSRHSCPICSVKIQRQDRADISKAVRAHRERGGEIALLTLTLGHGRDDDLAALLGVLKDAKRSMRKSAAWTRLKKLLTGWIAALEVTVGGWNGWHPHLHSLLFIEPGETISQADIDRLSAVWVDRVTRAGGRAELPHAVDFRVWQSDETDAASEYLTKAASWSEADELAGSVVKDGRKGRETPHRLLGRAADGDQAAGRRYRHYALAMVDQEMLRWSPKLKAFFGIGEMSDQEAAEGEAEGEAEIVAVIPAKAWRAVVGKYQLVPLLTALADRGLPGIVGIVNAASGQRYRRSDFKPFDTS